MPKLRLFSTSIFRLTLFSIGLFGASASCLFGIYYWAADHFMTGQFDGSIVEQMASLAEDESDAPRLIAKITQRLSSPITRDFSYLLQDGNSQRLAGNLPTMAPNVGWLDLPMPEDMIPPEGGDHALRALGRQLPDGSFLMVARDIYDLDEVEDQLERTFGTAFAVMIIVLCGSGTLISYSLLKRLEVINQTTREIMDGDLSRRINVTGRNNEFDRLSLNVNGMLDRIQELMENLRQVSNDIAHDLRTPLTHLRQSLEGARYGAKTPIEFVEAIDGALGKTDALLESFSALLRIAQLESGARAAAFAATDLSALTAMIVETYMPVAEGAGHSLTATISPSVTVYGDRQLLSQMMANLIDNALNHTPVGTRVSVALETGPTQGPRLVISDDGPGIPESEQGKVFMRFYRLDVSRSTRGSGLGLSLVAAIVRLHAARIRLEDNTPGLRAVVDFPALPLPEC